MTSNNNNKKISHKYYAVAILLTWIFAILSIITTWISFEICVVSSEQWVWITISIINSIINSLFIITLGFLVALLICDTRKDYKSRGWLFFVMWLAEIALFALTLSLQNFYDINVEQAIYVVPVVYTLLLIAIAVLGIYFWSRSVFKFTSFFVHKDAVNAFGGDIDNGNNNSEPKSYKSARDEKTGIVSL